MVMENTKDRVQAIDAAVSSIEKQFGKGAIMRLGTGERRPHKLKLPPQALSL